MKFSMVFGINFHLFSVLYIRLYVDLSRGRMGGVGEFGGFGWIYFFTLLYMNKRNSLSLYTTNTFKIHMYIQYMVVWFVLRH